MTSVHSALDVRILRKECVSLARAGFKVTLVAPWNRDEHIDGVDIKAIHSPSGRLVRLTRTVWQLMREAKRINADIYHFHDPELIPVGLLLKREGKSVIYDIHEDVPLDILSKHYLPKWSRKPLSRVVEHAEKFACRFFSALVPATPAIREAFARINTRTVVVQNFPRIDEFMSVDKPWSEREAVVAYIGNMTRIRGITEIVSAMAAIPSALRVTLKLAGDYSPPAFRDELASLPGWERVQELGALDRRGVAEVLGTAVAGLVVFHDVPSHREAYPTKMFEYMSSGLPVIASNFSRWREILDKAGCALLVDPRRPEAIAEAVVYIVNHPVEAEAMGRRGRELIAREMNWHLEEQKLLALYRELLPVGRNIAE